MPWEYFQEFIAFSADRFIILKRILDEAKLSFRVLEIAGNRHFLLTPTESSRRPIILVAHYDRAEGSPGANDNSAGVFLLIETAMRLKSGKVKNWFIIFSDREELKTGESIQNQGAFTLAAALKDIRLENSKIFSFDACGTGDTLVISSTADHLLKKDNLKLRESFLDLRKIALDTAHNLGMDKVLLAPTPFSDDLGFFQAGIAAQTITMLPSAECINLVSELRKNPDFAKALISAELKKDSNTKSIPETWRCLNSTSDSHLRLTPQYFRTVVRFAEALCRG